MPIEQYIQMKDGEKIVSVVRRYILTYVAWFLIVFILLIAPFFFLFPLLSWGVFGKSVVAGSLMLGVFFWLRLEFIWKRDCLIVTTHRVVDIHQRGFTKRLISESSYDRVSDVSHEVNGMLRVLFNYGTIRITCGDGAVLLTMDRVKNPKAVHHLISEMMTRFFQRSERGGAQTAAQASALDDLSREQLEALAAALLAKLESQDKPAKE